MDISDADLVIMCLESRRGSYEELINRYQHSVYNLAYRMTNSSADAEDITQETFLRAYRNLRSYKDKYSFKNWILTICANLTKNVFRKRVRRHEVENEYFELEYLEERKEDYHRERLATALSRLSPKLRVPLVLKHVEGCSHEEIAGILNIGVSAVKMRVKRGRDELMNMMKEDVSRTENTEQ